MFYQKIRSKYFFAILFIFISLFIFAGGHFSKASQTDLKTESAKQGQAFAYQSGLDMNLSVGNVVATVIKAFLGLLGIIFIILILIAGFNWMTAQGDEQKIEKAKETLSRAIIGLIIIVAAYSITYFVFNNLGWSGSGSSGPGGSPSGS